LNKIRAIAATALLCTLADPAPAQEALLFTRYAVDVKGVTIMKLQFTTRISGSAYATEISAKTTGMANWFSDYKIEMTTQGILRSGKFVPASFSRERNKNGKQKEATTDWSSGAPAITEENGDDGFAAMAGVVNASTLDPLSLLLSLSFGNGESPCKGNQRVFDGRDVYDVSLTGSKNEDEGRISCRVTLHYVAGKEVEDAKPNAAKPDVYGILLKPVEVTTLGRTIWMPERITGRASGQNFVASSTDLQIE
jgi:hypothetical protein